MATFQCLYAVVTWNVVVRNAKSDGGVGNFIIWLITRAAISQYSRSGFPVMPTGVMSDVNARLVKPVKREHRKCESTFDSNSWNDSKLNEKRQLF